MFMWLHEQWFHCNTCNCDFPGNEAYMHKGHNYYPVPGK